MKASKKLNKVVSVRHIYPGISMILSILILSACTKASGNEVSLAGPTASPEPVFTGSIFRANPQRTGVYNGGTPQLTQVLWRYEVARSSLYNAPLVADGLVFFTAGDEDLFGLDIRNGYLEWRGKSYLAGGPPTVADGVIYYGWERGLYAVDIKTNQQKWIFDVGGGGGVLRTPVIYDGLIYFNSSVGNIYGIDIKTGQQRWMFKTYAGVPTDLAIADGILYFSMGSLHAVDLTTGEEIWKFVPPGSTEMAGALGGPVVANGVVYCASFLNAYIGPGYVYAFDSKTGKELWKHTTPDNLPDPSALAVFEDIVYVASDPDTSDAPLYALDARTGEEKWSFRAGDFLRAPSISNGILYIGSGKYDGTRQGGTLFALDARTGKELHKLTVPEAVAEPVTIADGVLYYMGRDSYMSISTINAVR